MKKQDFLDKLQGYNPEVDKNFCKFSYHYPIKQTKKAILIFINEEIKAKFIPFNALRLNRQENHVYISQSFYRQILQGVK